MRPVRPRSPHSRRHGVAAVEAAVVLTTFLVVLFALFDVAVASARSNALSESACRAARTAIVRGKKSPAASRLGPTAWSGTAAGSHVISQAIRPLLITMPPGQVQVRLTWPDGGNAIGQRVRVEVSYRQQNSVPFVFGSAPWPLHASSTMRIVH